MKKETNTKQRLFEMMSKLDKSFKQQKSDIDDPTKEEMINYLKRKYGNEANEISENFELSKTKKQNLHEEQIPYSEWNVLMPLKDKDVFTREDLREILYTIYKNVYEADKNKMLELLRFFDFDIED